MSFSKIGFCFIVSFVFYPFCFSQVDDKKTRFEMAYDLYKVHDYKNALLVFNDSSILNKDDYASGLVIKGFVITDSISYQEGRIYFLQAELLFRNSNNSRAKCKNYFALGKYDFIEGEYDQSIFWFQKMDLEAVKAELIPEQKTANYYLAMNYQQLGKIPISNTYIKKAIPLAKSLNDSMSVFYCDYVHAVNYIYYTTYDSSTFGYADSIMLVIDDAKNYVVDENPVQLGILHDLYAKAYNSKNDFENRKKHALLSLYYHEMTGDSLNIIGAYITIAQAFIELEKYDSALYYQSFVEEQSVIDYDQGAGVPSVYYFNYYKIFSNIGDYHKAFIYLEKYFYEDLEVEKNNNLDVLQLREDFELEKNQQFILAEAEKTKALYEQKRNFYVYISFIIGAFFILIAYLIYYRLKSKKEKEQKSFQLLLQTAELSALKAQMNPHFIFNALNSIQHSIMTNNSDDASRFLSKFSKLIRNVLDSSAQQMVTLKTEIETLSLYVEIESKRFDHSFSFQVELKDNGFSSDLVMVPAMIFQPFIENAIWHGLMPKEGEKKLTVKFDVLNKESVVCEITDNGIGRQKAKQIAAEKQREHKSRGLANIDERVKLLKLTDHINVDISVEDNSDNGTTVKIRITKN